MKTISDEVARAISIQFIEENPSDVVVRRRPRVAMASGGYTLGAPANLAPQRMRLTHPASPGPPRLNEQGSIVVPTKDLVGLLDANVERFDLVRINNREYQVLWVNKRPLHGRTVAELIEYG